MLTNSASGGDAPSRGFDTPTLDLESAALLHAISEHGGYAYVSMAALAANGDIRAAEAACEMAWEQLHSGPWHSVLPVWRDAYSMACLLVARHHYRNGEFRDALRVLDLGIIMGGTLLRKDLDSAIEKISEQTRKTVRVSDLGNSEHRLVDREFDMAEVLQLLPVKSLSNKLVAKKSALSLEKFLKDHYLSGCPVIISDCMAHWPAKMKWNDEDYLLRVAGDRTVPVERIKSDSCSPGGLTYLAQHPLFDQVVGKKYIRLYSSSLSEELSPHSGTMLHNSSQVDLDDIDENKFPKVQDLEFVDCILEEGEMLYIPPKWWHYVRSLTTSFSVSFWWSEGESSDAS
ncbi:hypothetical protein JHK82_030851 [Glycine max]|nr:hypothetical protein JHK85_031495 [Glycine max]KAG4994119.1 hypothetical protein JHK86_030946 [Glycine max]KAG5124114.1 hypothetical protein JHK82_030851 [Glycine max]